MGGKVYQGTTCILWTRWDSPDAESRDLTSAWAERASRVGNDLREALILNHDGQVMVRVDIESPENLVLYLAVLCGQNV